MSSRGAKLWDQYWGHKKYTQSWDCGLSHLIPPPSDFPKCSYHTIPQMVGRAKALSIATHLHIIEV